MKTRSETGTIYSYKFSGVGGPRSGELLVKLQPPGIADHSVMIDLRLGWPEDDSETSTTAFLVTCQKLFQAFIKRSVVSIGFKQVGTGLPDIVSVSVNL